MSLGRGRSALLSAAALLSGCAGSPGISTAPTAVETPAPPLVWQWRQILPASGTVPAPRAHGVAVYDPVARRLVVFGGQGNDGGVLNDTWAFDLAARTWARLATVGTPPDHRLGADAVYDPVGHQMVVWAGQQGSRFFDDIWTLDLRTLEWRDRSPGPRPQARYGSASVFDPATRALVQFAGFTDLSRRFQDTQAFDLDTNTWEDLTPSDVRPQIRCLLSAAFHGASRRMIVYGGQRSGPLDDIWAFDLGTRRWTELTPATRPEGRLLSSSFIDRDGRFVTFGGSTATEIVNETWSFDLDRREWTRLTIEGTPPPGREAAMGAAFENGDRFVVFGGRAGGRFNDVWELRRVPAGTP